MIDSTWHTMEDAPKDGTLILLAYEIEGGIIDFEVGMWVANYGCPGWRGGGTFLEPVLWHHIPTLPKNFREKNEKQKKQEKQEC